jgi:hypothetical protein
MAAVVHPRKLLLFTLLSLSDLGLTLLLLRHGGGAVYESNPVAGWWLAAYGWVGLAAFKAGTVLVVAALAVVVSRSRPRAGGAVLGFGCSALALVVGYSCYLANCGSALAEGEGMEDLATLLQSQASIEVELSKGLEYRALLDRLTADLVAGRCCLAEATTQLAGAARARDPNWLHRLREEYGARSDKEGLAGNLIVQSLTQCSDDPAATVRLAHRLRHEFRAAFGPGGPGARAWLARVGIERKSLRHPGWIRCPASTLST